MSVSSRSEMFDLLTARMSGAYDELASTGRLESTSTLVKSYMIEAHHPAPDAPTWRWAKKVFGETYLGDFKELSVDSTDDPDLFTISAQGGAKRGSVTVYVDVTNPRYWLAHSVAASGDLGYLVDHITKGHPALDRAWFSSDLLDQVADLGEFRGLNLDFDRLQLGDVNEAELDDDPEEPVSVLKMQLWGSQARRVLDKLREDDAFPSETTLSKVRIRYRQDKNVRESFVLDDIKWNGKATARGTDFQSHNDLLVQLSERYGGNVAQIEDRYALRLDPNDSAGRFLGAPITFRLTREIVDLDRFCSSLFAAREPFRLWGVPIRTSDSMVSVNAVDLHIGGPMSFEVTSRFIRAYLPQGTCGNSILRLYANLQHYYDAGVQAIDSEGSLIVALQP